MSEDLALWHDFNLCVVTASAALLGLRFVALSIHMRVLSAMENIERRGIAHPLAEAVLHRKVPVLGICLGMQLLATRGQEDGGASGLGWIQGEVVPFRFEDASVRVPHVGFNSVVATVPSSKVFGHIEEPTDFYFVHSFYLRCDSDASVASLAAWRAATVCDIASAISGRARMMASNPRLSRR